MARRVDDVDAGALPFDRSGLGQNGDAALALEVVRVHGALDLALIGAVDAGLLQQLVDQSSFAMIDVRDDGDVAHIHSQVPKRKRGSTEASEQSPFPKSDRIAGGQSCGTRDATLLRRNIVTKRREATAL